MILLESQLSDVIDYRLKALSVLKRLLIIDQSKDHVKTIKQLAVTGIYSNFEGGIKDLSDIYLQSIASSGVIAKHLSVPLMVHALKEAYGFKSEVKDFEKMKIHASTVLQKLESVPTFCRVETESNLSPKVLRKIASTLGICINIDSGAESSINTMLHMRNQFCHGEIDHDIQVEVICRFSEVTTNTLCDFASSLAESHMGMKWRI